MKTDEENASELVRCLTIEDIEDHIKQYKRMLIELGSAAVKPLQDFIATEGRDWAAELEPGTLYPTKVNYDAARAVLSEILSS
jgi:hypothetical protein